MKKNILFLLKVGCAGGLLYWLISSGKLDFSQTRIILDSWQFFAFLVLPVLFLAMSLQNLRWWLLLKLLGVKIPFRQAFALTWIGNFFSVILPGIVSGDLIKGLYLHSKKKTNLVSIYISLFIDRILGLLGLLCVFLFSISKLGLEQKELILDLSIFIVFSSLILISFFCFIFYPFPKKSQRNNYQENFLKQKNWYENLLDKLPKKKFLTKIFQNFKVMKQYRLQVVVLLLISLVIHSLVCMLFYQISGLLLSGKIDFWKQMSLIPLGLIATAIPISPAGIGVGHVAFENLYNLSGLKEGANIFNLFIINQIFIYLLGFFPFLFYRRKRGAKN